MNLLIYHPDILRTIFKCKCGKPLFMFGCDNPDCENYWKKRLKEKEVDEPKRTN